MEQEKEIVTYKELRNTHCYGCKMPFTEIEKVLFTVEGVKGGCRSNICRNPQCNFFINLRKVGTWRKVKYDTTPSTREQAIA